MPMTELRPAVIDVRPRGARGPQGADGAPGDQVSYETRLMASASTIAGAVTHLRTAGFAVRSSGASLYVKRATEPTDIGKFQSADGAWWEMAETDPNVLHFGAASDGTTDDSDAVEDANSYGYFRLTKGITRVTRDMTIDAELHILGRAKLRVDACAVTITGKFKGNLSAVFDCINGGTVSLPYELEGRPEWWGCVANNSGVAAANLVAINACKVACPVTLLKPADYWISDTLNWDTSFRSLIGYGMNFTATNSVTRLIIISGTKGVCMAGTVTYPPGGVNFFVRDIVVANIDFTRSIVPVPPAEGAEASGANGLFVSNVLFGHFRHIKASEHSIGFTVQHAVRSQFNDCVAFRSFAGSSPTNDFFWGWFCNGGDAGGTPMYGNASVQFDRCGTSVGGAPGLSQSIGFLSTAAMNDLFIEKFEVAQVDHGMYFDNAGAPVNGAGSIDLSILNPILDQCKNGITFVNLGYYSTVTVTNPYVGLSSGSVGKAISFNGCAGTNTVVDGQLVGFGDTSNNFGISIINSNGVTTRDNKLKGFKKPYEASGATGCKMSDLIDNPVQVAAQAAVKLTNCDRMKIAPQIKSLSAVFARGIDLIGTGNSNCEIDVSMVEPTAIGGAGNKLFINNAAIVATGLSGSNLVQGVLT